MNNEETVLQSTVPSKDSGKDLAEYLSGRFRYHKKSEWEEFIREGRVLLNGARVMPDSVVKTRDIVSFRTILNEPPVNRNIRLIYQDEDFLVVDKPPHLPCHADGNFIKNTLIYILRQGIDGIDVSGTLHLAHRLDRETSGIVLLVKNPGLVTPVMEHFSAGRVKKEYLAVVKGKVPENSFSVEGYIVRDINSIISFRQKLSQEVQDNKNLSRTDFTLIKRMSDSSLLLAEPRTGRTNQIRIHLEAAGYPILGDKLYGKTDQDYLAYINHARAGGDPFHFRENEPGRHLLHAAKLSFPHPHTGERMTFEAPMPEDMKEYCTDDAVVQ